MRKRCFEAIKGIESFKKDNGVLPSSLNDIDFSNEKGSNEIIYEVLNDSVYVISYMHSIDFNMLYYSDTKKWYNGIRKSE